MDGARRVLEALDAERVRTMRRLADLSHDFAATVEASLDSNADDEHDPEGSTIAFERSQVTSLARRLEQRLRELEAARSRVEHGTYGRCVACTGPIGEARLAALPAAARCIGCATRAAPPRTART